MINFFRKIRKRLADNNMFLKYSRYAIGEIILVVIGILIALSINNWNEYRKSRILEQKVLSKLFNSLKSNAVILTNKIEELKKFNVSADTILYAIANNQNESIGLYKHFHFAYHVPLLTLDSSGYEYLTNIGLDIIVSEPLKNEIIHLFNHNYVNMNKIINTSESTFEDIHIYMRTNFFPLGNLKSKPFNYDAVMKSNYYSSIKYIRLNRGWYITQMEDSLDLTLSILDLIDDELNQ